MYRLAAAIILSSVVFAQNAPPPEIVRAAKSPYDLAKYINSHDAIDWVPLWQLLGVQKQLGLPCSVDCAAELIVEHPEQVILIVNASLPFDVYLRFEKGESGEWRVTGKFYSNVWDGNPHRHQIVRAGSTEFLLVSTHGGHGSGLDEEMEAWFDLSRPSFEPVFSYAVRGNEDAMGTGISRQIEAGAYAISPNKIGLNLNIYLYCPSGDLGHFEFFGKYSRAQGGIFALQTVGSGYPPSPITKEDFEAFVRIGRAPPGQEIRYALPRLKEIAVGKNDEAKQWLRYVLDRTRDTPETRSLKELLAKP